MCTRQHSKDAVLQSKKSDLPMLETLIGFAGCVIRSPHDPMSLIQGPKFLIEEVVGWKFLKHRNIVPFIGVALTPPLFSIISEWMVNGDIMCFTRTHPEYNRLDLVSKWKLSNFLSH